MTRFRTEGTNWEGRQWYLAPSLVVLARQVEELHPERQPGDGTVASQRHDETSPSSDHRPRPFTGKGIVRAIDAGESQDADPMVEALVASQDPRIAYIIYEGQIWRSYSKPGIEPWTPAPYSGPNPHSHHFHLSTLRDPVHDHNTDPWQITEEPMAQPLETWARDAFEWAIKKGFYTATDNVANVRETLDMQRTFVFLHRYHRKVVMRAIGAGGVTAAAVIAEIVARLGG